eukprot:2162537-Prymnesium_polylepis.1
MLAVLLCAVTDVSLHTFTPDPAQAPASPATTSASRRPSQEIETPAYGRPSQGGAFLISR